MGDQVEQWKKLKVAELKTELSNRGLSTVGKKEELLSRLIESAETVKPTGSLSPTKSASSKGVETTPSKAAATAIATSPTGASAGLATVVAPAAVSSINTTRPPVPVNAPATAPAKANITSPTSSNGQKPPASAHPSSEEEKRLQRMARFGVALDTTAVLSTAERQKLREQRFSGPTSPTTPSLPKNNSVPNSNVKPTSYTLSEEEQKKMAMREARFGAGMLIAKKLMLATLEPLNKKPLSIEEEKKRKRMERFSNENPKKPKTDQ